ncbi:MAG: carboxypeptidase-like regulatory domain-containing protein [Planctomycetaceae bacterium]|jgi:hypothetical protein|nr:carboxypeptidase-like regulatory domain-containing protein [Planctomycetaceae bacterium]
MTYFNKFSLVLPIGICLFSFIAGCNSNEGPAKVTGVIRLDGQPLPEATVSFTPDDPGAFSSGGGTDQNGQYELFYAEGKTGALPGNYKVTVSTGRPWDNVPEKVPEKYRELKTTDLVYTIKPGKQTIDIELKSM